MVVNLYNELFLSSNSNKNGLSSHKYRWRNLKCILLSARNQSENVTYCMIPTTWHSRKGKTMEMVKRSVAARGSGGGREG